MSDLNKYIEILKEYLRDDSDELQEKDLIDEPSMITTELYPWKLEINGDVTRLLVADGKPVITYVADPASNTLNVLFNNQNIDFDDLRDSCCKCAGESFSCTIECRSIYELAACVNGFIWLTADGYAVPQTNLIGMDLADVERVVAQGMTGVYRTALTDPTDIEACSAGFLRSVLDAKPDAASIILRFEVESMQQISQVDSSLDHIVNTVEMLIMANYLPGKEDHIRIDMWAF